MINYRQPYITVLLLGSYVKKYSELFVYFRNMWDFADQKCNLSWQMQTYGEPCYGRILCCYVLIRLIFYYLIFLESFLGCFWLMDGQILHFLYYFLSAKWNILFLCVKSAEKMFGNFKCVSKAYYFSSLIHKSCLTKTPAREVFQI